MTGAKDKEDRLEAAAGWLARLQSDDSTEADWQAFEEWLAEPGNRDAVNSIEASLADVDNYKTELHDQLAGMGGEVLEFPQRPVKRNRARASPWIVLVGGLAAAAAALVILVRMPPPPAAVSESVYSASATETRQVKLADNSSIWLNRGSAIKVQFSDLERRVILEKGEASFTVTHDAARPFVVKSGDAVITDIGTEFNVLRSGADISVTVRSGMISLAFGANAPVTAEAGQQVQFGSKGSEITLTQVNPDDAFAWQKGRLVFHDASLAEVAKRLSAYSKITVKAEPQVEELRFSGALMLGSAEEMVSQLQAFLPIRAETGKEEIVLKGR